MNRVPSFLRRGAAVLVACAALHAGDTRFWSQSEYSDFEKGNVKKLSLRSDGLVTLAPELREMFDTSLAYLWALARDSKGVLYFGGGSSAKLYRVPPGGKGELAAELEGLAVQAIAIDAKDRVYAATSPDGKVYRIAGHTKPEAFFDPKTKYIWALTFDAAGNLYVATGDPGDVYRVTPDGKGSVFFHADETHVRSMTTDGKGNLVVGTEPRGLVLRVSPAGEGFVVYQMPKKEVTAVAVAADGSIYAAAVGGKSAPSPVPSAPPPSGLPATAAPAPVMPGGVPQATPRVAAPLPATLAPSTGVTGGSDVYRIHPDGNPERVWTNPADVVYAIGFDGEGRAILGTGNHGNVYRIETPFLYAALLTTASTQVTAFASGPGGRLYAVTGNVGKLYEIGPELEREGTLESDVFDAALFSQWGRLSFEARMDGGHVALTTRSGNLDQPQKNWSPWSAAIGEVKGAPVASPAARFLQWKATLTATAEGRSPELESVDVAYQSKNLAPRVEQIEITPANYKFPTPITLLPAGSQPQTLNLPPLGKHTAAPAAMPIPDTSTTSTPAMQWAKGWMGARWVASDPNGDSMTYTVEIRGESEAEWKPLKQKVADKYHSFDSTAFPDGDYRVRITASDAPSNPPADALTGQLVSEVFTIDNTPPRISALSATRNGGKVDVHWHAADALSNIDKAEYSLDGGDWTVAAPVTRLSDSLELDYALALEAAAGEHTIAIRVEDDYGNPATDKVVVR